MISNLTFKEEGLKGKKNFTVELHRKAVVNVKAIVRPVEQGFAEYGLAVLNNSATVFSAPLSQRLSLTAINSIKVNKGHLTITVETKEEKTVYLEVLVREI